TFGLLLALVSSCTTPGTDEPASAPGVTSVRPAVDALPSVLRVEYANDGVPYLIAGQLGRATGPIHDVHGAAIELAAALPALAATFQLRADDLVPVRVQHDRL